MKYLRACAAGGGHWAAHNSSSFGGNFLCPKHQWSLMHGFDPRPHGQGGTDSTVRFIDFDHGHDAHGSMHAEQMKQEWVVLARDGDTVTLRPLGNPDAPTREAPVALLYPASPGAVYRHAAKCGPAPVEAAAPARVEDVPPVPKTAKGGCASQKPLVDGRCPDCGRALKRGHRRA